MSDSIKDEIHKRTTRRLRFLFWLVIAVCVFIISDFFRLMVIEGRDRRSNPAQEFRTERGPILDRNGTILAMQTRLDTVTAWTPGISQPAETAELLGDILSLNSSHLMQRFRNEQGFLFIKRTVSQEESDRIRGLKSDGKLEGIHLQEDFGRSYPEGSLAAHVLGYVGIDNQGLDGIEYRYNRELTAANDRSGQDSFGSQVVLTIDSGIQSFTDHLAAATRDEHQADAVMIIVMDSYTGEILAYSAQPGYDPNDFSRYTREQRRNIPISYLYEPGSVFKIFTMASFLHLGVISPDEFFNAGAAYQRFSNGDLQFSITDLNAYGMVNAADIIRTSSNVGAAHASDRVSNEQLYHMLRQFGFGERSGIQLNGEERGILRPPESWSARTKPTITIGQEIAVSAMQMLAAASVFTNDGVLIRPQIVRRIVSPDGTSLSSFEREPVRQVISPGTAQQMLDMMVGSTLDTGTAWRARVEGIQIAAKTGTAQMMDPDGAGYSDSAFIPSTLAIFPADDPQVIAYTVIINPQAGEYLGGRIAAPVIRRLAEYIVPYLGIPREGDTVYRESTNIQITQMQLPHIDDFMPDFTGLPKRTLMPLYNDPDLDIIIRGNGWVVRQEPPPGTPLDNNSRIILELE